MNKLDGQIALVTGAGRGIGSSIAQALAQEGAHVIINYLKNAEAAQETVKKIISAGGSASVYCADVTNEEQVDKMFRFIAEYYGKLDILVNNAAILSRFPFVDIPTSEWERIMNGNVRGYFLCGQRAARLMIPKGYGRIIKISSISQWRAAAGRAHYCASKGSIGMLSKCMALELAPHGITVNIVAPGSIHTDFNDDVLSDAVYYARTKESIPAGRLGKPNDINAAVVMLASAEADYINGSVLAIDGAMTV